MKRPAATRCGILLGVALVLSAPMRAGVANDVVMIPAGSFRSVLPAAPGQTRQSIGRFALLKTPVTNGQFATFVAAHPSWRRDRVAALFADAGYLSHWTKAAGPARRVEAQPVTHVSWFAATAYCEAQGGRLPTWYEWEYVAAADESHRDARDSPRYRQQILDWYAEPNSTLAAAGRTVPNAYGLQDLHGVVWEWVQDFHGLLVSGDSREQGGADQRQFCGSGALALEQKDNYAIMMRIAMLSSLQAKYTTANVGFRCAFDAQEGDR